ncbi:methylglyoxal reductase (NADPH-dependent) gre2 [Neonectria punicea]|uniref:Methylglyoxal reductase (NADPH-dependent) gre2 n=1 Tax=Neonectria punicea TaxID=979145 RepID=A0ABR1HEJ0_9HYPO
MTKVLLTGGSGFIAAHVLEQLLEKDYSVVATVRSEDKARKIREAHKDRVEAGKLEIAIVPDIAQEGAFDEVAKTPGIEAVLHTASPVQYTISEQSLFYADPKKDLVDPALIGTTGILKALHASAHSVKRVVVTSSFASIIDEAKFTDPSTTFTETSWNPVQLEDIHRSPQTAYRASKKLAERAAWDFVSSAKPSFGLVTVCPPLVLGPVVHHLATLDSINTSNERVVALLRGGWRDGVPASTPVPLWIDVRDLARAHVRALEEPGAAGRRLLPTPGWFTNREVVEIVRAGFPEFADRIPGPGVPGGEFPPKDQIYGFNNDETNRILGFEWTTLEKSITDLVTSLKAHGI